MDHSDLGGDTYPPGPLMPDATLPYGSTSPRDSLGYTAPPGKRLRRYAPALLWIITLSALALAGLLSLLWTR